MAAYAAVLSLARILQELMDHDRGFPYEKQQIHSLQEKVSFLVEFLENYSVSTDKVVKDLEIKIRDAAHEAEEIIESYISTSILSKKKLDAIRYRVFPIFYQNLLPFDGGFPKFCRDLDRVIEETHSIQQEAIDIKGMLDINQRKTLHVDRSRLTFTDRTPHMVGLVEDSMKIKGWLTSSSSKLEVISIVGMGGIGKTTFARNLFCDSLIVYNFHVRAWATVSQEYQMPEILAGLLDSIVKLNTEVGKASSDDLGEHLYKSLKGRTYLFVLDDIWDIQVWDEIKRFFPDDHNGSRIVLTTRLKNVGAHAASFDCLHDMNLLSPSESWTLLCDKAFGGDQFCPPCLEGIGQEIIRNCRGLPLSIVVIGGLLSTNITVSYWETIVIALNSILAADGGECSTIFSLSYDHLPAHLKPCYLYFAIFPEDYSIRRSEVIMLWIAEGFIKPNGSKSLEDIAEAYLQDLLNRSLIMVLTQGGDGKIKRYRIHDLLRDFCKAEAQKEKFLYVTDRYNIDSKRIRSERRVSIQRMTPLKYIEYDFTSNGPPLSTRSLLLYDGYGYRIMREPSSLGVLLRVLYMRSKLTATLREFPMDVVRLVHLRYLSLCCSSTIVPAPISTLWGLQTLVFHTVGGRFDVSHLPLEVWTMLHLRHVRITSVSVPDPPYSGLVLANLQTLSRMRNFRFTDEIIKRIPKLKKLGISYDVGNADWSQFHLSNIVCLNELESLHMESYSRIAFPPNFKFPTSLKKLTLDGCELRWEDLKMVGSLPNLEVLKLNLYACEGQVWEPNEGEFRELKVLRFYALGLMEWRADDSHFPKLKCLEIYGCSKLKEIPVEIGNIQTLEKIKLERASPSVVASAKLILDQQQSLDNDLFQLLLE